MSCIDLSSIEKRMQEGCTQCKKRNSEWIWVGCNSATGSDLVWIRTHPETGLQTAGEASAELSQVTGLEFPKHISKLPDWVFNYNELEVLNLKCCCNVLSLPIDKILNMPKLKELDCEGCSNLCYPAKEICNQGGKAALRFLQEVNGQVCTRMNLFLIGDGEAGKTSVVMALKSRNNSAYHIRTDHRTIGIDITSWQPAESDIVFDIYDLAGQAVYTKTHQLFLLRRAVYIFVWRAGSAELQSLQNTVLYWLDSLQNRVPGSYVLLVATHIDQIASDEILRSQCTSVKDTVSGWLTACKENCSRNGINAPCIFNEGESVKVNCLLGDGITDLRKSLLDFIISMPWYKEGMPSSWIEFQSQIAGLSDQHRKNPDKFAPYITTKYYCQIAQSCGVLDSMMHSVTTFLHDSGVIRYFGKWQGQEDEVLNTTIYISPVWMMQVMKGLIRHDMQTLQNFFLKTGNKTLLRYVNKLTTCGLLHEELIPFLWPSRPESKLFWDTVRQNERESQLWPDDIICDDGDAARAVALLEGFDLAVKVGCEYAVPGILPPAMISRTPALDTQQCPFRFAFKYDKLPSGIFDVLIVRLGKIHTCTFDFASTHASFYHANNGVVQLFRFKSIPELQDHIHAKTPQESHFESEVSSGEWLVVRTSHKMLIEIAEKELQKLEMLYPGLTRLETTTSKQAINESTFGTVLSPDSSLNSTRLSQLTEPKLALEPNIACIHCHQQNAFDRKHLIDQFTAIGSDDSEHALKLKALCPNCKHAQRLIDLVTTFRVSEIRQCPFCLANAGPLTGTFNAGECRLRQSFLSSGQTITCTTCLAAGRLGKLEMWNVSPEEIYVSGFDLLQNECQSTVAQLICDLEIEADICCCKSEPKIESKLGTSDIPLLGDTKFTNALVVMVIFTDAFFESVQCVKELMAASSMKKCIIPVVLPSLMSSTVPNTSWTDNEQRAFVHAVKRACEGMNTETAHTNQLLLQNIDPCLVMKLDSRNNISEPSNILKEVTGRIKSHIQRPGKVDVYADFSLLGIRLQYFERFISERGGRDKFEGLTTLQMMEKFILPETNESKLSFCELLDSKGLSEFVGRAEWFYSHAWKYRFLDVVDSARLFFANEENACDKDPILWFDVFSVSQHKAETRPFDWWNSAFLNAVGSIGKVLMVMQPFEDNETKTCAWVTLTRVWCVFELFACESTMSRFEVTMTKSMSDRFLDALRQKDERVLESLLAIKCEDSEAFKEEDKERVFEVINRTIGFPLLNSLVMRVMERWIYSELLKEMKVNSNSNHLKSMKDFCELCKDRRERTLLGEHADSMLSKYLLRCITQALSDQEYLSTLKSQNHKLVADAEKMMNSNLEEKAKLFEEDMKAGQEHVAKRRGQALLEAEKALEAAKTLAEAPYKRCFVLLAYILLWYVLYLRICCVNV